MIPHNLVIFCKSYLGDLERLKILKASIDKFNKDNIPFCLVVPQKDIEQIKKALITGKEEYKLYFKTDEEILNLISGDAEQGWVPQQVIKLNAHKTNLANFYCILDSDCYFITDFFIKNFMYNETTPYTVMRREHCDNIKNAPSRVVKEFFDRDGLCYGWAAMPTIFSAQILDRFFEYLNSKNLSINNLLTISPYEFIWYGEFLWKTKPFEIIPTDTFFYSFWYEQEYRNIRRKNTINDFIQKGYIGLNLQAGWVREKIYKPSKLINFYRAIDSFIFGLYYRNDQKLFSPKWFEVYLRKCVRDPLKILFSK